MKRSDIIRLIQKEIYSITQDDILYDSFVFSRNLLDKLENAGMLPPEVAVTKSVSGDLTSNIFATVSYSSKIRKWEKENETK